MADKLTQEQAAAELARAQTVSGRVKDRSRWIAAYLAVFGVAFGVVTLILGLVTPLWLRMVIFGVLWACLVLGMTFWARLQPAVPRSRRRRGAWGWAGTTVLYAAMIVVGTPYQLGRVFYWLPAAVLVATPLLLAAWWEYRR